MTQTRREFLSWIGRTAAAAALSSLPLRELYADAQPQPLPQQPEPLKTYRGFQDARFQRHDPLIRDSVGYWNSELKGYPGYTPLDPNLVKAMMLVESGGSAAAWTRDPMQSFRDGAEAEIAKGRGIPEAPVCTSGAIKKPRTLAGAASSIELGTYVLARKAMRTAYNKDTDTVTVTGFRPWLDAAERYNGGGDPGYRKKVEGLYLHDTPWFLAKECANALRGLPHR